MSSLSASFLLQVKIANFLLVFTLDNFSIIVKSMDVYHGFSVSPIEVNILLSTEGDTMRLFAYSLIVLQNSLRFLKT